MKWMRCLPLAVAVLMTFCWHGLSRAEDQGWPREIKKDDHSLVYYQPQVESWKDRQTLEFKAAVMLKMGGESQSLAGAVWLKAETDVDLEHRTVRLNNIEPTRIRYSVVDSGLAARAEQTTKAILPKGPLSVSLDRILAGISAAAEAAQQSLPLKNDAPRIIVSTVPARLVIFDGEPMFAPVEGTNLQYVINTNWDLFNEAAASTYYLLDENRWMTAADLNGPWQKAMSLPTSFANMPLSDNWKEVRKNVPPSLWAPSPVVPVIHVTTTPAELVVLDGKAKLKPVKGTNLSYVANTDSDLFVYKGDSSYYLLVAGRWFRTKALDGPWEFATASLPKDFTKIPKDHPKARVLASVPGTPEAQEAVLVASIPQTAKVSRKEASLKVVYSGDPVFKPIEGTPLFYAVNSQVTVIQTKGDYYACDRGVWFVASAATGPWLVAASVPQVIYSIPASSPVYNVTYVTIYESTPDYVVTSYTSGYMMGFVTAGVVFWGSGYYHPPYWYYPPAVHYPIYYPRPYTYGAAAWYNPATNSYYRGGAAYGPYGGIGAGAVYNPATGAYGRGVAAYGPYGGAKIGSAFNPTTGAWAHGAAGYGPNGSWRAGYGYNPQTGISAAGRQGTNMYGSWGQGVVKKGDKWVSGGYSQTSEGTTGYLRGSEGGAAVKGKNNSYVGKDGEVYKKSDSGWQKYEDGQWGDVQKPTPTGKPTLAEGKQTASANREKSSASATSQQTAKKTSRFGGGEPATQQAPATRQVKTADSSVLEGLNRESSARAQGEQRTRSWQGSSTGASLERGNFGGGSRSGGFSGGGRRR